MTIKRCNGYKTAKINVPVNLLRIQSFCSLEPYSVNRQTNATFSLMIPKE